MDPLPDEYAFDPKVDSSALMVASTHMKSQETALTVLLFASTLREIENLPTFTTFLAL